MCGAFYGWYFKCQSDTKAFAVIPAVHGAGRNRTCSVQFITEDEAWTIRFPGEMFCKKGDCITIGKNRFSEAGIRLDIVSAQEKIFVKGNIEFVHLTPLKYDIMGPFAFVPFMECRHSVYSMCHRVVGKICINEKSYVLNNALGYWEGDKGRSFPKGYIWTQCLFADGSMMLAVADIPLAGMNFTGIISIVIWKGKEYRFATYLGARVVLNKENMILIRQGKMELEARLLEQNAHPLHAPENGEMVRTIHENLVCKAFYRFRRNGVTQFAFETDKASFEYEY